MNLFRKREVHSPEVSGAHSPYLAARREWDERYGDLITRARNWRTMAAYVRSLHWWQRLAWCGCRRTLASFHSSFWWTILAGPSPRGSRIRHLSTTTG